VLLENKNAVIYGGGGAIGGAVARAFAREGAKVHLAGHTLARPIPEGFDGREAIVEGIERLTLLGRAATLEDVGNAAVFAASDWARTLTATTVNISCDALID